MIRLQTIDGRLADVGVEIKKIPALLEKEKTYLRDFEVAVEQAKEKIEEAGKRQRKAEGEIQSADGKLRETRSKQVLVKSNEEYKALTSELESLQGTISRLEDEVLEAMERTAPLKETLSREEASFEEAKRKVSAATKAHEDALFRLKGDQENFEKDRKEILASINSDWISRYNSVRENRSGLAVCAIIDRTCQGCRMSETISRFFEIRDSADEIFACSHCERILYYQDAETVGAAVPSDQSE